MKKIIIILLFGITYLSARAQAPVNDNCSDAIEIDDARDFCSLAGEYTNANATEQFVGNGNEVWFQFVARAFEVKITLTRGTLQSPEIKLYTDCNGSGLPGLLLRDGDTIIFTKSGLTPGGIYYISISGENNATGSFQLCTRNYNSAIKPGQDFQSASLLCNVADSVVEMNITGAGLDNHEARGTCLDISTGESNTAWYKWTAANSGTLVFNIIPNNRDDIDWVLFDLGPEASIQQPSAANAIRCAAGHGLGSDDCPQTPQEPGYTMTGLGFGETDTREESCSGSGQNGIVKYIDMVQGHVYGLIIDNFTSGNNGFKIVFTDRDGKAGTGEFVGPSANMTSVKSNECTFQQSYTFTGTATGYKAIKWYFGEDASIDSADTFGPFDITYNTPGLKTVLLQVTNDNGCSVVETQTFLVGLKPDKPVITANKPDFCIQDTIRLTTLEIEDGIYHWTGPNNFSSTEREVNIPVNDFSVSGTYRLTTEIFGCMSEEMTIDIPPVLKNPTAAFSTRPGIVAKFSAPLRVTFNNESLDADTYLWDFGDGSTSTEVHPVHDYITSGDFDITLTAFKSSICHATVVHGTFIIREGSGLFIPNTFTPNADAVNDEFVVTLTNLNTYHIRIFNRWGEQLFEAHDIFNNWKGIYKGQPVPVGTYYYVIDALDINNLAIKKSGSVTVIR